MTEEQKRPFTAAERAKRYRLRHPKTPEQKRLACVQEKRRRDNMTIEEHTHHVETKKRWYEHAKATGKIIPYSEWPEEEKILKRQASLNRYYRDPNVQLSGMEEHFQKQYGISIAQRDQMILDQNGLCAICHLPPVGEGEVLQVDHNHDSGNIRGMLCHKCNKGLGKALDSTVRIRKASDYLKSFKEPLSNIPVNSSLPIQSI